MSGFSKKIREEVYNKYDGHCAYCGCKIEYKDMQIDHKIPILRGVSDEDLNRFRQHDKRGTDDIDNLEPSCHMCNFYKMDFTLDGFRNRMNEIHKNLERYFIFRLALKYGIVKVFPFNSGEFFFERFKKNEKNEDDK